MYNFSREDQTESASYKSDVMETKSDVNAEETDPMDEEERPITGKNRNKKWTDIDLGLYSNTHGFYEVELSKLILMFMVYISKGEGDLDSFMKDGEMNLSKISSNLVPPYSVPQENEKMIRFRSNSCY